MSMSDGVIKTIITLDEDQFSGRYSNAAKVDIIKKKWNNINKICGCRSSGTGITG